MRFQKILKIEKHELLPFKLQREIMKRLPVKSLIRFRAVSKAWKSIIHTSEFISEYDSLPRDDPKLLVSFYGRNYIDILNDDNEKASDGFIRHKARIPLPGSVILSEEKRPDVWASGSHAIGYAQGLFGFMNFSTYIGKAFAVIWNPSIKGYVEVSVPNVLTFPYDTVVGFGVRNATSDPIIVKINSIYDKDHESISSIPWQVEVFTLSSGAWRTLSNSTPRKSLYVTKKVVVIDGVIYWLAVDRTPRGDDLNLILAFDIAGEVFSEIPFPPSVEESRNLDLFMLKESLVLVDSNIHAGIDEHDVWMMKLEDGVQHSFEKLYTVKSPYPSIQRILGFRKNGQPIIQLRRPYGHDPFFSYEPDTEQFDGLGIFETADSCFAASYIGTLLLLDA